MNLPSFPASTSTGFDDLMKIRANERFVLSGYEYRAEGDAVTWRRNGFETVSIKAKRRNKAIPFGGWEIADVLEHRPYVGTLDAV